MNTQELQARWGELRGKVKEKWGQLTNDDLQIVNGDIEQMLYRIQRRTGADLEAIEEFISDLVPGGFSFQRAREALASQASAAADAVRGGYEDLTNRARDGAGRAGQMLREHPTRSMAAVLGTGVLCGVLVGLLVSSDE